MTTPPEVYGCPGCYRSIRPVHEFCPTCNYPLAVFKTEMVKIGGRFRVVRRLVMHLYTVSVCGDEKPRG